MLLGLLVAFTVFYSSDKTPSSWLPTIIEQDSIANKHIRGKVMFLGKMTKKVLNHFD